MSTARIRSGEIAVRELSPAGASTPAFLAAWDALAINASEPNPFFEGWFAQPSLIHLETGAPTALIAVYDDGALIGIVPAAQRRSYYGYLVPHVAVWLHDNAFCSVPLVARGLECQFWRALLQHLDHSAGRALFLHLPQLPADGSVCRALDSVLAETGRPAFTVGAEERAMLASNECPETYLAQSMSAKKRKELRRQRNRLGEEGALTFERCSDAQAVEAWVEEFLALESAGWKGDVGSALASAAATRNFFAQALTGAAHAGRLERLTLRLDGQAIAMLVNFITPPGMFSFKTAFDERFARYSPGLLLQIENLNLLARTDIAWADSCAAEGHSMIERVWREKRRLITRNIAIGGSARRLLFKALMAYETRDRSPS
ncbi:GNAT family N-acetyltransferase [Qipengyuania sp. ASV99]|uniref:GNAT family N-acetyltransferase n=1 Tax=Qipengyuania sp. ASV99 TaxID=3399681 RepID=UPI003A4C7CF5